MPSHVRPTEKSETSKKLQEHAIATRVELCQLILSLIQGEQVYDSLKKSLVNSDCCNSLTYLNGDCSQTTSFHDLPLGSTSSPLIHIIYFYSLQNNAKYHLFSATVIASSNQTAYPLFSNCYQSHQLVFLKT